MINLFSGPGTGKSFTAGGLFFLMKLSGKEVELVTEYAKYLVWSERVRMFREQTYILAKQNHKLEILRENVDWAITDSPLMLSQIYGKEVGVSDAFNEAVHEMYDTYDNINIFLNRKAPYNPNGRNQTADEAVVKDNEIKEMMDKLGMEYIDVDAGPNAPWEIYEAVFGESHFTNLTVMDDPYA